MKKTFRGEKFNSFFVCLLFSFVLKKQCLVLFLQWTHKYRLNHLNDFNYEITKYGIFLINKDIESVQFY